MRTTMVLLASCFLAASALAGCGDDDGGGGGGGSGRISFPETCPDFTPCGGNVEGSWTFDSGCVPQDIALGDLQMQCPEARVTNVDGHVTGTLMATATNIERRGSVSYSATVTMPSSCTMGIACSTLTMYLQMGGVEGSCRDAAGGCACTLSGTQSVDESTTYTISGSTLTTAEGDNYDFCVTGDTLTYREPGEPATLTLVR